MQKRFSLMKISINNKGFTLVELIIGMVILSIVLSAVYAFFLYNHRMYNKSKNMSQIQYEVRMTSEYLASELRNVSYISLSGDGSLSKSISIDTLTQKYPLVSRVAFKIKSQGYGYLLEYDIHGSDSKYKNEYTVSSQILLNNVTSAVTGEGNVIYYE